jgi:hypothetical protein
MFVTAPPIVPVPPKVVPLLFTETAPVATELLPLTNNVPAFYRRGTGVGRSRSRVIIAIFYGIYAQPKRRRWKS